jgi:hypothetical protein
MGTWGTGNLDNDIALDLLGDVRDRNIGLDQLRAVLQEVASTADYLDADLCCEALAAAEVIALMSGSHNPAYDEELDGLPLMEPDNADRMLAKAAVKRIALDGELKELWEEDEADLKAWKAELEGLLRRLN